MNPIPACNILLLLSFTSLVAAANFTQCLEIFKANPNATGGVDSNGRDMSAADAVGLKYETCKQLCGATAESFNWRQFAQLFSSWLLPWLALISQLPFGSGDRIDNFLSVLMSVGSPALAAYSLMITSFNTRMVYKRTSSTQYKKKADVAKALVVLQQKPLRLTKDTSLLESLCIDSQWRKVILGRLNGGEAWSVATAFSIAWVVISFTFTLVDSFVSLNDPDGSGSDGLAVGTLWLWLLCLVIGWLWIPIFSSNEVSAALDHANGKTNEKAMQGSPHGGGTNAGEVSGLGYPQTPDGYLNNDINMIYTTQHNTASVPYPIGAQPSAAVSATSLKSRPDTRLFILKDKKGFLYGNEFRHPATFNYSRVMWYLELVDDVIKALDTPVVVAGQEVGHVDQITTFPTGAFRTMLKAAVFALLLQIGITSAAVVVIVFTPTVGLGCRSLGYIIYGGVSIIIMFLTIISTILARISETRKGTSPFVENVTAFFAITLRWICYLLALINSVGLIVLSCLQFSNFLANCYCNSSVIGDGKNTYIAIVLKDWIPLMKRFRAVGVTIAAGSMFIFMVALRLISSPPTWE